MCKTPVVQKLDSTFHRINLYPVDKYHPVDSGVLLWNNWGEQPVSWKSRKLFGPGKLLCFCCIYIQDESFDNFENNEKRSKIDWFIGEELCYYLTGLDFKITFGPEKFSGLSRIWPADVNVVKKNFSSIGVELCV